MMENSKIINYNYDKVIVEENEDCFLIDFQKGLGKVTYPKKDWTLARALYHQAVQNYKMEIGDNCDIYEY